MILDLNKFNDLNNFYDHMFSGDGEKFFNLKSVKAIKDIKYGIYDTDICSDINLQKLIKKEILQINKDEGLTYIPNGTIGELTFEDETITFIVNDEKIEIDKYSFKDGIWEIDLTELGQKYYKDNIEDIFSNI